jgi:hypothetical protein
MVSANVSGRGTPNISGNLILHFVFIQKLMHVLNRNLSGAETCSSTVRFHYKQDLLLLLLVHEELMFVNHAQGSCPVIVLRNVGKTTLSLDRS